ncbi:MAG: class I SAM-dependent methyltransferase [Anaerolineae bacterium]
MSTAQQFYDAFASDYDHFVNWTARLSNELPFIVATLTKAGANNVLDVAGGTGQHAIALAHVGFAVSLADISPEMVQQARRNAIDAGVLLSAHQAGFGELSALETQYDALLCLGNSIPHIQDRDALHRTIVDMASVVRPGGVLIWQLRNFQRVLALQERFMGPQAWRASEHEHLFIRFYDFIPPHVRFNLLHLHRSGDGNWEQTIEQTVLAPWILAELSKALAGNGWGEVLAFGNLGGEPYQEETSSDLVLVATKSRI